MRKPYILFSAYLCIIPRPIHAGDIRDIPPGEDRIVVLQQGEKAPFTGQLYDSNTALRWANWLLQYKFRLKTDVDYIKSLWDADVRYTKSLLEIEKNKYLQVTTDYQKQTAEHQTTILKLQEELRNPPFYRSVWFGVLLGVVITGAAVGVGIAATR